jgi:nitrate/TMAO reductase-like tetraheme cytochrome c subunit
MSSCIDCHDETSDTTWVKFHFPTIELEFKKSIHSQKKGNEFSCFSCHNPHATTMALRNDSMPLHQVIQLSNELCIKCHSLQKAEFRKAHDRFPHNEVHLQKNRCIDCHAQTNDSLLIPHNILDKEQAT